MSDRPESSMKARVNGFGVHLGVIATSFVLSLIIAPATVSFDPEGSGALITLIAIIFGHAIATAVGLCFSRSTKTSCTVVFCVAFFFTGVFAIESITKSIHYRFRVPYDRFRDWIASPVPDSVSNLRFPAYEEGVTSCVTLEFDIDPTDMHNILKRLQLAQKAPDKLLNPKDYFQLRYYFPVAGDYVVYQQRDYSPDDPTVVTIKTNAKHNYAIYRRESLWIKRDHPWEKDEMDLRIESRFLEQLKQKYETNIKTHKANH